MQYYIEISSWNLLESFVTESISPYSFYMVRNFGNSLSRYLSGEKEKFNYLILSTEDLGGDISLVIDESLIDHTCLKPINKRLKTAFTYPKTIYYRKGLVKFRFGIPQIKDKIIAESQILLEVKCLDKYITDFFVKSKKDKMKTDISKMKDSFSFERQSYIDFDDIFNKIKGAIVGYVRGLYTSPDTKLLQLHNELRDLKNSFGGLNTQIMMAYTFTDNPTLINKINLCKSLYVAQFGSTNSFDVILAQYQEIIKLAELRAEEHSNTYLSSKEQLINEKTELEDRIAEIELDNNIFAARKEYESIKADERRNGEKVGKSRVYFKKGTGEYERKQFLKNLIRDFEKDNVEYKEYLDRLCYIEQQLNDDTNKYDSTLSALFIRISDILNEVIKNATKATNGNKVNLSKIELGKRTISMSNDQNSPEICFLNILLDYILKYTSSKHLSEHFVLQVMEESAKLFKDNPLSKTNDGEMILSTLRGFWLYKNQRAEQFNIPDNMPILQSIMSFFVKPLGFEQIERYMSLKNYSDRSYAFMLWGAWIGFADMPKTFTSVLYQDDDVNIAIESLLNEIILANNSSSFTQN